MGSVRLGWGWGGSKDGAVTTRVGGSRGRGEGRGAEGGQDRGQNIQVLVGWLSNQGVGIQTCSLANSLTGVPT